VAEGTPEALKKTVGTDVIVAQVGELPNGALEALRSLAGVEDVVCRDDELMVHAGDGAAAMSPVALALHASGTTVKSLTLRTPTLDDVFLQLTGSHLQADEANTANSHDPSDPPPPVMASRQAAPAGTPSVPGGLA
jgi:ABC-2 type transport system ATP-binding protein